MTGTGNGAFPFQEGTPRDVQQAAKLTGPDPAPTVAPAIALRGRRAAARRMPLLSDGHIRDPLDDLAGDAGEPVSYGSYDVITLGLCCAHGDGCPGRRREAV